MRRGRNGRARGIVDEKLLDRWRQQPCAICGKRPPSEAHHLTAKGIGGGNRKDVDENILPLCLRHHREVHDGNILRDVLMAIVAYRGTEYKEGASRDHS